MLDIPVLNQAPSPEAIQSDNLSPTITVEFYVTEENRANVAVHVRIEYVEQENLNQPETHELPGLILAMNSAVETAFSRHKLRPKLNKAVALNVEPPSPRQGKVVKVKRYYDSWRSCLQGEIMRANCAQAAQDLLQTARSLNDVDWGLLRMLSEDMIFHGDITAYKHPKYSRNQFSTNPENITTLHVIGIRERENRHLVLLLPDGGRIPNPNHRK